MSDQAATISVQFTDGTVLSSWDSFSLTDNFTDPLGSCQLSVTPQRDKLAMYDALLQKGNLLGIKINGKPQTTPQIQRVTRTIGMDGVRFQIEARSVLATAFEGSVDPNIARHFNAATPLVNVVLEALAPFGFEEIVADTAASVNAMTGKPIGNARATVLQVEALKETDMAAQENESAYAFASRFFSRHGVVLRVDWEGKLTLCAPDYDQDPLYTVVQGRSAKGDKFLDGLTTVDSNDGQFSEVLVRGSAQHAGKKKKTVVAQPSACVVVPGLARPASAPFANVSRTDYRTGRFNYRSDGGAPYKPRFILDKKSHSIERCLNAAHASMGVRALNAYQVNGQVNGVVSSTGAVWNVNTIVRVVIDAFNIDEPMWVLERTLTCSMREGQRTRLVLVPKYSLLLGEAS